MEVTLSTGRKFNIKALTITQAIEAVRLTRSVPQEQPGSLNTMAYMVRGHRDIIGWALTNAGADPAAAEEITGGMQLDEMTEILSPIMSLTVLTHDSGSKKVH